MAWGQVRAGEGRPRKSSSKTDVDVGAIKKQAYDDPTKPPKPLKVGRGGMNADHTRREKKKAATTSSSMLLKCFSLSRSHQARPPNPSVLLYLPLHASAMRCPRRAQQRSFTPRNVELHNAQTPVVHTRPKKVEVTRQTKRKTQTYGTVQNDET